jgi:hypothetical protein
VVKSFSGFSDLETLLPHPPPDLPLEGGGDKFINVNQLNSY